MRDMRSTGIIRAAKGGYVALSAAFCALGAVLMARPGLSAALAGGVGIGLMLWPAQGAAALNRLLGLALVAEGALNLCVALCAVKIIAHQRADNLYS